MRGTVRDAAGLPIALAEITEQPSGSSTLSDSTGAFRLPRLTAGYHVLLARRPGFFPDTQTLVVGSADSIMVNFVLKRRPVELQPMNVRTESAAPARLEGFERRRLARNGGRFITAEQIARRGSHRTSDILRGIQGIQMVDSMGTTIAISSRGAKVNLLSSKQVEACVVRVGVDGLIKDPMFSLDLIAPTEIHGVEIYAGAATIPPEFNSTGSRHAQCGLIMIWTRSR